MHAGPRLLWVFPHATAQGIRNHYCWRQGAGCLHWLIAGLLPPLHRSSPLAGFTFLDEFVMSPLSVFEIMP